MITLALVLATALAGGADADASRRLIAAAARSDAAGVLVLLRNGADPDLKIARLLLQRGASPDLRARARGTALDVAESSGWMELARVLRAAGARGSGKSIGDSVCVRPWSGDGYCAVVLGRDATRFELQLSEVKGCERGCAAEAACSGGKVVGRAGLAVGDKLWVPASCLTHTGVR